VVSAVGNTRIAVVGVAALDARINTLTAK
jgi:hypothetical protein